MSADELTILVADDEPENAAAFARALRGYRVLCASRGDEALSLLAEHRVDIILADQMMPGTTGALVLRRGRAINPLVRRIIVSASAQPHDLLQAINQGEVERYLLKPIAPDELRRVVDALAAEYRTAAQQKQHIAELQEQIASLRRRIQTDLPDGWDRLEVEVARARRYARALTLLVAEEAAPLWKQIQPALREIDVVVTIGTRLVVALPETSGEAALAVVARLEAIAPAHTFRLASFPGDGADLAHLVAEAKPVAR